MKRYFISTLILGLFLQCLLVGNQFINAAEELSATSRDVVMGDANGDREFDSQDMTLFRKFLSKIISELPNPDWKVAMDANKDGIVDQSDYDAFINGLVLHPDPIPSPTDTPQPTPTPTIVSVDKITDLVGYSDNNMQTATVKGTITSGANKKIALQVKDPKGNIEYSGYCTSDDGNFSITYAMRTNLSGDYTIYAHSEGLKYSAMGKFYYHLWGDLNNDGTFDLADYEVARGALLGISGFNIYLDDLDVLSPDGVLDSAVYTKFYKLAEASSKFRYGDLNSDEKVDSADYTYLRRYLIGVDTSSHAYSWKRAADIYRDGNINSADYTVLRRFLLGKISDLPGYPANETLPDFPTVDPTITITPTTSSGVVYTKELRIQY